MTAARVTSRLRAGPKRALPYKARGKNPEVSERGTLGHAVKGNPQNYEAHTEGAFRKHVHAAQQEENRGHPSLTRHVA